MTWLPGWDSIDGADRWHNIFFWIGISLLVLLAIAEAITQIYSWRKDALITQADGARVEEQQQESARRDQEAAALRDSLAEADKRVAKLHAYQAQRHISDNDKNTLIRKLSAYKGQKIIISSPLGDDESETYRDEFVKIFDAAGWDHNGPNGVFSTKFSEPQTGIRIVVHQVNGRQGEVNNAILLLKETLEQLNLLAGMAMNQEVPPGAVEIIVGAKQRPTGKD